MDAARVDGRGGRMPFSMERRMRGSDHGVMTHGQEDPHQRRAWEQARGWNPLDASDGA